jgi:uracil-DNA glycosylase
MKLFDQIPASWQPYLEQEFGQAYIQKLEAFLEAERATQQVFPPAKDVFRALELTPFENVKVVILGQDPYHDDGQAHGLAFSVQPGIKPPPSLVNMFKELETDLGIPRAKTGFLEAWAKQGVLMLNAVLTVRAHAAGSHQKQGWEKLTDAMIKAISNHKTGVVFVLWGRASVATLGAKRFFWLTSILEHQHGIA